MLAGTNKSQRGFTLTSVMVALALSGVLAVAAMRLTVNQMKVLGTMELIDKGDAIYKFYSNLLHDDQVWWCTLYDGAGTAATTPPNPSQALRDCIFDSTCNSGPGTAGTALHLKGPDCEFKEPYVASAGSVIKHRFTTQGALDLRTRYPLPGDEEQFKHSPTTFIPESGKTLRDSVMVASGGGWWEIDLKWKEANSYNEVDLIYTQKFNEGVWRTATGRSTMPDLNYPRVLRVRRSANYIQGSGCGTQAVTNIALHTARRAVNCGQQLINTLGELSYCPTTANAGAVVESTTQCSSSASTRVSVTPTDCSQCNSVIWQIGSGSATPDQNVICALDGLGKMVEYGGPSGTGDYCGPFVVSTPRHLAITHICKDGGRQYATLEGWPRSNPVVTAMLPATGQGQVGPVGPPATGPKGPDGPTCANHGRWSCPHVCCGGPAFPPPHVLNRHV